jgi:hypothetical protein
VNHLFLWGGPFDGYSLIVDPEGQIAGVMVYWHEHGVRVQSDIQITSPLDPAFIEWSDHHMVVLARNRETGGDYYYDGNPQMRWVFREIHPV